MSEHGQRVAPLIPLEKGDVAVFDKAFTNFAWYASLLEGGSYFVTRLRKNADYRVVERRDVHTLIIGQLESLRSRNQIVLSIMVP